MPFSSSSEMLAWLGDHLLVNSQQTADLIAWGAGSADLHSFCKELLRRGWLTPYQVSQLLKHDGETLIVGANRLIERLGEGAMGQVFRAWNVRLGRMVAVKMLHVDHALSAKAMERFRREMQTAAALVHPNIVLLRDADEINNIPYLVMDYYDAPDLSRKMKQEGPPPLPIAVDWIRQAAAGLQHAFERGVVHRDVKPSNLLLVKVGENSYVIKILDFGLAKFEREEGNEQKPLTQAGRLIGTVDFVAPEQAVDARQADIRADIYSLGCTLFYFLTGKAPFAGADHLAKLSARIEGQPPRLNQFLPSAPPGLEDVLLKMLARDPANRYQTPQEVVAALTPFCQPVAAPVAQAKVAVPIIPALPPKAEPSPVALAAMFDAAPFTIGEAANADVAVEDSLPFGNANVFEQAESPAPLAKPLRPPAEEEEPAPASSLRPIIIGLLAFLVLALGGGGTAYVIMTKKPVPNAVIPNEAKGTMALSFDSPPANPWPMGVRRPIIVKVKRENFTGPVTVAIDPEPDWLVINPPKIVIKATADVEEFRLTVRYQTEVGPKSIRFVATSPDSQPATIEYQMDVTALK